MMMTFEQFVDALNDKLETHGLGPVSDPATGFARWTLGDINADISPLGSEAIVIGIHRDGDTVTHANFRLDNLDVDHAVEFIRSQLIGPPE